MARKRSGGADGDKGERVRGTAPVQVKRDLARMAAVIASHDGITQAALVDPVLRPFLLSEYRRVQAAIGREIEGMTLPPPRQD